MDVKLVLVVLTAVFTVACLFFGTKTAFMIPIIIMAMAQLTNR